MPLNQTIDDTLGNSATGQKPVYTPATGVWNIGPCIGCVIRPDSHRAFQETWTEATYRPEVGAISIQFSFKGTAIYVYFITANTFPVLKPLITTETACNFTLNGQYAGSFSHTPTQNPGLEYNVLAFSKTDLPDSEHDLIISTSGVNRQIYVNFDYAIFTIDDSVTPSQGGITSTPGDYPNFSTTTLSTTSLPTPILNPSLSTFITLSDATTETTPQRSVSSTSGDLPNFSTPTVPTSSPPIPILSPSLSTGQKGSRTNVGAIAGGVVGGVVALLGFLLLTFFLCRHRRERAEYQANAAFPIDSSVARTRVTPFPIDVGHTTRRLNSNFLQTGTITSPDIAVDHPLQQYEKSRILSLSSDDSGADRGIFHHNRNGLLHMDHRSDRDTVRQARQLEIESQMQAVSRKMINLNTRPSVPSPHTGTADSNTSEMGEMREELRVMKEQLEFLRQQQQSAWAQGLSDEAPPGYAHSESHE